MTKKAIKKLAAAIPQNDADLQKLLSDLVIAQTDKERAIAARDAAIEKARTELEMMHGWSATIERADNKIDRLIKLLETWTSLNAQRLGSARSIAINGHRFGWRLGNWKTAAVHKWTQVVEWLEKLIEKGKAEDATDKARRRAAMAAEYIVYSVDPDKKAMLRDREKRPCRALLKAAGVTFEQDETFYFEPAREGQQDARIEGSK